MFCISMSNQRKLPKFHHIPLQDHRFPINRYYPGDLPNIVTVYDRPYVLDFLQQAVLQKTLSPSLYIIKIFKNSKSLISKIYIPECFSNLELTEKSFISLTLSPKLRKAGKDFQLLDSFDGAQEIYGSGWLLHDMSYLNSSSEYKKPWHIMVAVSWGWNSAFIY